MATSLDLWEEVAPLSSRSLLDEHREVLEIGSGISPEIIEGRGYYSLDSRQIAWLVQLEIVAPATMRAEGWMGIPIWRPDGQKHGEIIRVFGGDNDRMKYVWPTGLRLCLDIHPQNLEHVLDTSIPVFITEGIKKADAVLSSARREGLELVVLAANGCDGWRSKIEGSS